MAGQPKDREGWGKAMDRLARLFMLQKERMKLICEACKKKDPSQYCKQCLNRRGDFRALSFGLSFGGGQKVTLLLPTKIPMYSILPMKSKAATDAQAA